MQIVRGHLVDGCPAISVEISSPNGSFKSFEAVVDTGFNGFISMSLIEALPLGVSAEVTLKITQADGKAHDCVTAPGHARLVGFKPEGGTEERTRNGMIVLQNQASDILLGMEFLERFELGLFLAGDIFILFSNDFLPAAAAQALRQPILEELEPVVASQTGEQLNNDGLDVPEQGSNVGVENADGKYATGVDA